MRSEVKMNDEARKEGHRLSSGPNLLPLFMALVTLSTTVQHCQGNERRTKYGCEGTTLTIACEEGTVINLVRANFGRFSISICNEEGITDWSVNCMEPRTLRVINTRCDGKPRCRIPVDSSIFGDPCPGTNKYVEVHYTCEPVKTPATTAKPLPPWLLDLAATPSTVTGRGNDREPPQTTTTTTTTTATTTSAQTTTTTTATTLRTVPNPMYKTTTVRSTTQDLFESDFEDQPKGPQVISGVDYEDSDSELKLLEAIVDHCPPKTARGLFWNWTRIGEDAIQVCPQGSSGFARWSCGDTGMWSSESPNLGECQSLWLSRLEQRLMDSASINNLAVELSAATETKSLYGGDFSIVAKIMQALAHRLRQELYVMQLQNEKETLVAELMQSVLKTASNLLDATQKFAWDDLNGKKRAAAATNIMMAVEENALLLAETINNEKNLVEATNNIMASVRIMRARGVYDQVFPEMETVHTSEESSMLVPSQALQDISANGAVRIVFFLYNNLETILPPSQGHFVNSKVLGAVASKGRYVRIDGRPVAFTLRHLETHNARNPVCVAWDYPGKRWAAEDCRMASTNATHTSCLCKRLANYAILSEEALVSAEPHEASTGQTGQDASTSTMVIIAVTSAAFCLLLVLIGLVVVRRTDLKPRIEKFLQARKAQGGLPCFHCKKSDSQTSSGSGLYPALTSSPTSTTVSAGTPTTMNASSNYLVQILEQQAETMKQVKIAQKAMPQQYASKNSSIYQVTAPRAQQGHQQHPQTANVFRPVSPYGHHIYMEIDPVYAHQHQQHQQMLQQQQQQQPLPHHHQHMESEAAHSDIQLSDISDDDLRRFSDSRNNARYAEERPLIRANNIRQSMDANNQFRQCMTAHRNGVLRPVQVATLSGSCSHHSLRGVNGHRLRQPIFHGDPTLEAPITIALQGGEQFVSLKIDNQQQQQQHPRDIYAPVHH